jgi:hypothetical protein
MTSQNLIWLKLLAALIALACGIGAIVTVYLLYQATPPATSVPPASPAAAPAFVHAVGRVAVNSAAVPSGGPLQLASTASELAAADPKPSPPLTCQRGSSELTLPGVCKIWVSRLALRLV